MFAASSLSVAFVDVERKYEAEHPTVDIRVTSGSSDQLVAQIQDGAEADLIATADRITAERLSSDPTKIKRIAGNSLSIVVAPGQAAPKSLQELSTSGLSVVIGAPNSPIGRYTQAALNAANVTLQPMSLEPNAKAVLAKVQLGEVDAAVVYTSDARTAKGLPFHVLAGTDQDIELDAIALTVPGQAVLDFILSNDGQALLRDNGFDT